MSYVTGLEAVKANLDAMAAQGNGGDWLNDLYWDGKKSQAENRRFVRFLTDDVLSIGIHEYIETLNGKKMDFVCARALATPRDCIICDTYQIKSDDGSMVPAKPRTLTFGVVALRDETFEQVNGKRISVMSDVMVEVEDQQKVKKTVRDYRMIRQSQKTFWANLHGYFARYGTIIDRDYEISRSVNTGSNTVYTILPCDPIDGLRTKEKVEARYSDCPETIVQYIERSGAESRYKKFLIKGGVTQSTPNQTQTPQSEPTQGPSSDTSFSSLKDKLMSYSSQKPSS